MQQDSLSEKGSPVYYFSIVATVSVHGELIDCASEASEELWLLNKASVTAASK